MFTGIIEETGTIEAISPSAEGIRLVVRAKVCAEDVRLGDSIAVNGCCLTVVAAKAAKGGGKRLEFDLLQETWDRTSLSRATVGSAVNLERALAERFVECGAEQHRPNIPHAAGNGESSTRSQQRILGYAQYRIPVIVSARSAAAANQVAGNELLAVN